MMKKPVTLILSVLFILCNSAFAKDIRKPAVAGAFYASDKDALIKEVDGYLNNVKKVDLNGRILAIIVPHAGYMYSGQVAAYSFKQLEGADFKKFIIISPSHYVSFDGMSVYNKGYFETPLGLIKINEDLSNKIINNSERFIFYPDAHKKEHAIEVELPFLQRIYKDFTIVPITMGSPDANDGMLLGETLYNLMDKDTLLIISVDLSHYHSYDKAVQLDTSGLSAAEKLDPRWFLEQLKSGTTEIDAPIAVLGTMILANKYGAKAKLLKYANSGDVTGDKSRVVGYSSLVIYIPEETEKKEEMIMEGAYLNKDERLKLVDIARASIKEAVTKEKQEDVKVTEVTLRQNSGAFVTIKKHDQLRGCIGYIMAVKPLYETVQEVARSAAISDPRFRPVSKDELDNLEVEISVLTPFKRIADINEVKVGKHGLYMKKGFRSGLLLPQVATEHGWDRETFLGHTCQKAGLPIDAWQDKSTEIYVFSAEVFDEKGNDSIQ